MAGLEIPFLWQIVIDVIAGVILGGFVERIQRAMLWAGAMGFMLTIFFFAFGNPESFSHLTVAEASEKITIIVTSTVYFMVHLLFAEMGAIPSNLAAQFLRNR